MPSVLTHFPSLMRGTAWITARLDRCRRAWPRTLAFMAVLAALELLRAMQSRDLLTFALESAGGHRVVVHAEPLPAALVLLAVGAALSTRTVACVLAVWVAAGYAPGALRVTHQGIAHVPPDLVPAMDRLKWWLVDVPSVATTLGVALLVDALRAARQRAHALATTDGLTGVLNRRAFTELLTRALTRARARERRRPPRDGAFTGALSYIDLDGFKAVNDTQGHDAGDAVLQLAAEVLRGAVRSGDVVARLGGDEFALWLPGASSEDAEAVGRRVLAQLRERAMARGWAVGASIGVAVFDVPPPSARVAMSAADALMYDVKRSGKGRVHVALVSAAA